MSSVKLTVFLAGCLLAIAALEASARTPGIDAKSALSQTLPSDGRSGWDVVGQAQPAAQAVPTQAVSHQARKRELVRRMFMLMVAYR